MTYAADPVKDLDRFAARRRALDSILAWSCSFNTGASALAAGQVSRPVIHRSAPALEQVGSPVGRLDLVLDHVRKATRAEPPQRAIYDALGIHPAPGGTRKTIV